jgi:hypothetical protein
MELSSSSGAANCAATQEFPSILWNPNVHYCVRKSAPQVPILSQINQIHIISSYLSKIHFNIVHPTTVRSPHWMPSESVGHVAPIENTKFLPKNSTEGFEVLYWLITL